MPRRSVRTAQDTFCSAVGTCRHAPLQRRCTCNHAMECTKSASTSRVLLQNFYCCKMLNRFHSSLIGCEWCVCHALLFSRLHRIKIERTLHGPHTPSVLLLAEGWTIIAWMGKCHQLLTRAKAWQFMICSRLRGASGQTFQLLWKRKDFDHCNRLTGTTHRRCLRPQAPTLLATTVQLKNGCPLQNRINQGVTGAKECLETRRWSSRFSFNAVKVIPSRRANVPSPKLKI